MAHGHQHGDHAPGATHEAVALDPETIQLDLGADPIAFAKGRIAIARDLFKRQETRSLPPDRDYAVLRRSINFAIADTTRAMGAARVEAQLQGKATSPPSILLKAMQWLALRNVRIFLGLQNVKSALTGAAPVPPDLIRWYLGCGIELREAFGMTETTGFCTATPKGAIRLGWAGVKPPGTEIQIGKPLISP
jgi:acyl-CoA synthetase (AMP-forming)/AMP-acid ligase II